MTPIDIFAWFIFLLTIASIVGIFVFLGLWPIMVADSRNHPQRDAIKVASWASLIMGAAFWPLVLVWAYSTRPSVRVMTGEEGEAAAYENRIRELEARLARLEAGKGGNA